MAAVSLWPFTENLQDQERLVFIFLCVSILRFIEMGVAFHCTGGTVGHFATVTPLST